MCKKKIIDNDTSQVVQSGMIILWDFQSGEKKG